LRRLSLTVSALALCALSGCGSDHDPFAAPPPAAAGESSLETPENVRTWANSVSALGLYLYLYRPIAVADGEQTFDDPSCPVTEDDGTTLSLSGGCTDTSGQAWLGTASVTRSANGDRSLKLDDFGTQAKGKQPSTAEGEGHVRRIDDDNHDFSLDLVNEGDVRTTIAYEGHVTGGYDTRTVWSGSGTVTREGSLPPVGTVDVTTTGEVVDEAVCRSEPSSGNTTIHSGDETVVVTYCNQDQAASYSYNGVPKGEITGITCAVLPGRSPSGAPSWVLLALASALGLRRRRHG
jgi:hypothetical protein